MALNGPEWAVELLDEPIDTWGIMYDFIVRHVTNDLPDGWNANSGRSDLARCEVAHKQNESERSLPRSWLICVYSFHLRLVLS
jgi:hypothetical protein